MAKGFETYIGVRITHVAPDRICGELEVSEHHLNRAGRMHGGALMAFADELGGRGAAQNLPQGGSTTTIESKTNFLRGAYPGLLSAESIPLHRGRSTSVWQTTISDANSRVIAIVTQTQMVLLPR